MPSPPVLNLDDDTLLTVFDTITQQIPDRSMRKDRPLASLRTASQVCSRWRRLLLASPRIWGRVIDLDVDLDCHGPQRIEWMEEVVRRTGSAPLWISGYVIDPKDSRRFNKKSYFIRLLKNWERIEQLSVTIFGQEIPYDIKTRFLSRAPSLKLFDVDPPEIQGPLFLDTLQPGSSQCLFADYAPLLFVMEAPDVAFKMDSSWLPNIRVIDSVIPRRMTLKEFTVLLQHTPVIESIAVNVTNQVWDNNRTHSSFPKPIILPKLSSIWMETTLEVAARMLDYVSPGKLSTLRITVFDFTPDLDDAVLHSLKKNLPFCIASCFTSEQLAVVTSVLLDITKNLFKFSTATNGIDELKVNSVATPNFIIKIKTLFPNQLDNDHVITCLLDTFTLGRTLGRNLFNSITKMRVNFDRVNPTLIPNVYSMLAAFHHVQHIETNDVSIQTLLAVSSLDEIAKDAGRSPTTEQVGTVLFPKLCTLRMVSLCADDGDCTYLPQFLIQRKQIGFPVAKLDLTNYRRSYYMRDLRALEEVDGLEVVWKESRHGSGVLDKIYTYICGTGEPERLIIDLRS